MITIMIDGIEVEVELQVSGSTRVQHLDGSWSTHLGVTPIIVSPKPGPDGGGGEPLPITEAA